MTTRLAARPMWAVALVLALASPLSCASDGLSTQAQPAANSEGSAIQPRVRLGFGQPASPAGMVVADYYLDLRAYGLGKGFRASGGLMLRGRSLSMAEMAVPSAGLAGQRSALSQLPAGASEPGDSQAMQPYFGLGYSQGLRDGGLVVTADIGLLTENSGNVLRLGKTLGGNRSFDDALRELRLAPMIQLGVRLRF